MSGLLFICVMEHIFRSLTRRWKKLDARRTGTYYGIVIDDPTDPLTNLRFADDVLLVASCRADAAKMIADLNDEAQKFGLKLHLGKTCILTNSSRPLPEKIPCRSLNVRVLQHGEAEKYLGRRLTAKDQHETELQNRMSCGWKASFKFKGALTNRRVPLKHRYVLFESVVTPSVLYACSAWALTAEPENSLRKCRRRMLRWMVGVTRRPDEEWPAYMHTANALAESPAETRLR